MIFAIPELTPADEAVLEAIEALRRDLRFHLAPARRWYGSLRRATLARAVQGSNSIEGYRASVEDVLTMLEEEPPVEADPETRAAIEGYRDAMTLVLQMSPDLPRLSESLLRSLHFMMLKHDLSKHPGNWRPLGVQVVGSGGRVLYTGPDRALLEGLVTEALDQIAGDTEPVMVRAAFAHLNLVMIHPFSDGNGRMARVAQSCVLAGEGDLSPVFLSIEEYLGRNTAAYYAVLREVGGVQWSPQRDARPWLEFCLTAHYRQALTVQRRIRETEALWDRCEQIVTGARVPDRCVAVLVDAARGLRMTRSLYVKITQGATGEAVSDDTASRDLRACSDAGLLSATGEKRGRSYRASETLAAAWAEIRRQRPDPGNEDPYAIARGLGRARPPG
jgi:Fic family protein